MSDAISFEGTRQRLVPLRDTAQPPSMLPTPLTSFLGREAEIEAILALLDDDETRLLTLTGPGGVGKTRLAIEVARRIEHDFADGVIFVRLDPIRDPALVLPTIGQLVGASPHGDRQLVDLVANAIRNRHLFLVLDNFEHLLAEPPVWLPELLGRCPRLKVLVTSRVPPSLGGEQRYPVPTLPVPGPDAAPSERETTSVRLFVLRARAAQPGFTLDDTTRASVEGICRGVDGLPLAIELAAARIGVLTPAEMLARLTDRFTLLRGNQRDVPARLRTMRDAIAWSYELLDLQEQRLFRQFSVFVGGFTLEAAEFVGGSAALDGIASLVDASLVRMDTGPAGETRYRMLETIREFGLERLVTGGDEEAIRNRHADWCVALVNRLADALDVPSMEAIDRLDSDHANLRAVLVWLVATGRHQELARLLLQTYWFWQVTVREAEVFPWFTRVLAVLEPADPAYVDALVWAGNLANRLGRPESTSLLEEALVRARAACDRWNEAFALTFLGIVVSERGDYTEAEALLREAREIYRRSNPTDLVTRMDYELGVAALGMGNLDEAERILQGLKAEADRLEVEHMSNSCAEYLVLIACEGGDLERARAFARYLDTPGAQIEIRFHHPTTSLSIAVMASLQGEFESVARLFGAASASDLAIKLPERAIFERAEKVARSHLGEAGWDCEWQAGRRMRTSEIQAEIDRLRAEDVTPAVQSQEPDREATKLTDRELEVLRLLADGLTNQEIGDALFVSRRTISTHIDHILTRLDLRSRTAAVAYAIRNGLA